MGLMRAQISTAFDTLLARDRVVNTLYFDSNLPGIMSGPDADALAEDLANVYSNWLPGSAANEIDVRFYDMDAAEPRPILGRFTKNTGVVAGSSGPREVALCLSFYATRNLPHQRGRIYLPGWTRGTMGPRPAQSQTDEALALADGFSALGGVDIDWCTHSPTASRHDKVTHAWVDDEWDTQRSRGLRPTRRSQKDVSG